MKKMSFLLAATIAMTTGVAMADWPVVHLNGANNAVTGTNAVVTDLTSGAFWNTGAQNLLTSCRPVVADGRVYTVATESSPDRIWIKAFDAADGSLQDESPNLAPGFSVSFGTTSSPSVDVGANALYYNTGDTAYRLSTTDLTQNWSTVLSASNTDASTDTVYTILNASPTIGADDVYTKTYPTTFGSVVGSQVVALDATSGAVQWYAVTGGRGTASPLYIDLGASKLVVAEAMSVSTTVELVAFDSTSTGAATPTWTISAPIPAPSSGSATNHGQWAEPIYDSVSGKLFGVTSNFSGGRLWSVDAATGTLDYAVEVPGSDIPPVLVGGELLVVDAFNQLSRYNPADGSSLGTPAVVTSSYVFRDYIAATNDGFYFAKDGEGLRFFDLTGVVQSTTSFTGFAGPVTVDPLNGYIYTYRNNGSLSAFTGATSVRDWLTLQ